MYNNLQIRVRVDEEGNTHVTTTEYTEDGVELTYVEHEQFTACPERSV